MSKVVRAKYENGMLKPLDSLELDEGEVVQVRIERSLREKLKDIIGILGRSDDDELERYLEETWTSNFLYINILSLYYILSNTLGNM